MRFALPALAVCLAIMALELDAQAPPVRVRGVVQALEGQTLVIATENEGVVRLTLTATTGINGVEERALGDITDNAFIGTTAVRDEDGRWRATEVHIFPESMRGAGEGHYAWDLPDSTMTNGAVTGSAAKRRGRTLTVSYAGGTQEIDITRRTAIVALTMGDRSLLVPGATVFALAAPQQAGGATAVAIIAETDGVEPPM
jgi:hypothetical protein